MSKKNSPESHLNVLALQLNSSENKSSNLNQIRQLLAKIQPEDVHLIVLPEVFNYRPNTYFDFKQAETVSDESIEFIKQLAINLKCYVIGGSFIEKSTDQKVYNTSIVINPSGNIANIYRKIHLFDVDFDTINIQESKNFLAGKMPQITTVFGWRIGLSICYDLRFPELYRYYFKHGVDIITIPASFTYTTGQKHWLPLCQARAIENQSFIIAPNQCGFGANNVKTYGNSVLLHPDGMTLEVANDSDVSIIKTTFVKDELNQLRTQMPVRKHAVLLN